MEEFGVDELVHDLAVNCEDDKVEETAFQVLTSAHQAVEATPYIAYESSILQLAPQLTCDKCDKVCDIELKRVGSAVVLIWKCPNGHVQRRWCSQPRLHHRGINLGDFQTAINILLSGNNYRKIALFFNFMGIRMVDASTFSRIQRLYCVPTIDTLWNDVNAEQLKKLENKPVVVSGDGRNDSPGHCAQYCTYTLMEHGTGHILAQVILDKRMTTSSVAMEKEGLRQALTFLQNKGIQVTELVTDAHTAIAAMMRKDYSNINHQWDVWHGAKNLGKKLHAKADIKGNEALKEWVPAVTNHFWYCSSKAKGSKTEFLGRWRGIVHHTTGVHQWLDGTMSRPECDHPPMDEPGDGKKWLQAGGPAHQTLGQVVFERRFLNTLDHYLQFRHTGELEVFHQHLLMYAGKRFAFSPPVYKARNQLAALDYHLHADRPYKIDAQGNIVHRRMYNKRSKNWFAVKVKEPKQYIYIANLQKKIVESRITSTGSLSQPVVLQDNDPRHIARTLLGNDVPTLQALVERQFSRHSLGGQNN